MRGSHVIILSVVLWIALLILFLNLDRRDLLPPWPFGVWVATQVIIVFGMKDLLWSRRIDSTPEARQMKWWRVLFRPGSTKQSIVIGISIVVALTAYHLLDRTG